MQLYADEDFPLTIVEELRRLGHDVVTTQEDGYQGRPDYEILARAHFLVRPVLTHNRRHFERLHLKGLPHSGIVSATQDPKNPLALAARVDSALSGRFPGRWHIRVNRPMKP